MKSILNIINILLHILVLFSTAKSFSLSPNFRDNIIFFKNPIKNRLGILNMDYSEYRNFDDVINILSDFNTRIIINNWIKYISPQENTIEELLVEYEKNYDEKNKINSSILESNFFPDYLIKSLYDFKIFIAINRSEKNLIYFGWCPDRHLPRPKLAYIIAGKVYNNNTIYIHRIAQNPYYDNMLNVKSIDLVNRLEDIEYSNGEKFKFNYDKLHEYDNRYQISWDFYKN